MANQDKDRVSGKTLAATSTPAMGGGAGRPGVLAVRLWSAAGKRVDCRWSRSGGSLSGLVLDLIRASGGVAGAENADFVAASFADTVTAVQCARRVQWSLEGLTEYESFRGAAAAILVDEGDALQRLAASPSEEWEGVDPGKIVLRGGAWEALEGVPGVTLSVVMATGSREWEWRPGEANASFVEDEQALLGMLRAAGKSDPAAGAAEESTAATQVFRSEAATGLGRQPKFAGAETEKSGTSKLLRMPIVAGAVAAVLIVAALVFFLTRKSPVQSAVPGAPASGKETRPGQNSAQPAQPPAVVQNQPKQAGAPNAQSKHSKLGDAIKKLTQSDQKTEAPPPPVVSSRCDLTEEDIQRSLARADRDMHDGNLAEARAAYQHVLGCSSVHERAQEGLIRIQRMAAQSGPPNM